jgi:GH15 family glucan-1,4-alpha-glucosidase
LRKDGRWRLLPLYVECLACPGGLEDAPLAFEKMLTYGNHLDLYPEQIGPTGELVGNFPQAFTHLALISPAVNSTCS